MCEHTWPLFANGDANRSRSVTAVRVDRHKLLEIVSDIAVIEALWRISYSTNGIRSTDEVLSRLLELIFELVPAQRGAVLLVGRTADDFATATYCPRTYEVNGAIARQALRDRVAVIDSGADSVLCVPLRVFDTKLGVIYLDRPRRTSFDRNHLHLLIAIGTFASLTLQHTRFEDKLQSEKQRLSQEIEVQHEMIGESRRMQDVYQFIRKAGPKDSTVLITGESGTGKELVARGLHRNSPRAASPFVAVDCGAIADTLIESELFGNEKGAFTGATAQRKGKIEAADGGTLFLDEIGELKMPTQAALLRVLQEREFCRVGGTRSIPVDVRVVAATNRNLPEFVEKGLFRQDLYFRLNVVAIRMPSLAERRDDIPLLTEYFIQKFRHIRSVSGIAPEAMQLLTSYPWPGNVRELQNAMENVLVLGGSDQIRIEDLPESLKETRPHETMRTGSLHATVNEAKRFAVIRALEQTSGNIPQAARLLDMDPSYLHRLMRNLGLKEP